MLGRVIKCHDGLFDVMFFDNILSENIFYKCCLKGIFRHNKSDIKKVLTGDNVVFEIDENEKDPDKNAGIITEILPRKNSLIRPPIANIDILFVVIAAKSPDPDFFHTDKITAISFFNKITPVIVINKTDLDDGNEIFDIYSKSGFDIIKMNIQEDNIPKDTFYKFIKGNICAFCGSSGVGKTSIINKLFPELALETGDISEKTQRGKHTTKSSDLYEFAGGFIADTPGFNILDFEKYDYFSKQDTLSSFPDLDAFSHECKFSKCSHTKEEGCGILKALDEGKISSVRHKSYMEILKQLNGKNAWDKKI